MSILPRRWSIKYHLAGVFSAAVAMTLIVSGAVIYALVADMVQRTMMDKLAIATTSVRDVVEHAAAMAVRNHLRTLAEVNLALLDGLEQQVRSGRLDAAEARTRGEELLLRQSGGGGHVVVSALSSRGIVQVHPEPALRRADLSTHRVVRQQMLRKNGYLEDEWQDAGDPRPRPRALYMLHFAPWDWIVSVSCDRQDLGFLVNDLRLGLKSHRFGETGYAFIVSTGGELLLHPWLKGNVRTFENEMITSVFARIVALKKGAFFYEWEDQETSERKKKIVFFDYIPALQWIVASTVYVDEMLAPLVRLGWIICLTVAGALVCTVWLSLSLGSMITAPLSRLTRQMQGATEDRVDVVADEQALGEIGLLGRHFNAHLDRLRQSNLKVLAEIRERIQTEQQLLIYRQAVEHALEGIVITDADANILAVNRAFTEITGYAADEVRGSNCRVLQSGRHGREFYEYLWQALLDKGRWTGEMWNRRKSGEVYPQVLSISAIDDQAGWRSHYVGVFHDVTEMKRQEEHIAHQAYHDALTGLPNRLLAFDRIKVSIAHVKRGGTKLAVLFLDLDNFKNVNDTLGHEWGDRLLLQVANRLAANLREEDTVARLGGDEFLVLVAAVASESVVIELVKRLLHSFALPFTVAGSDLFVTVSIGVAFYPDDGGDPGTLTKHADIAMYQAKARGKNNYCLFTSELSERISTRQQMEHDLRQAVLDREFIVFFQPKCNPSANTVVGAEALVRWRKKDGSIVNPNEFIPLAEETGLIVPLGEQILEYACQVLNALGARGRADLTIAVNLSPLQFIQGNLVERIAAMLLKYGIAGSRLELEITETAMMTNLANTVKTLNRLVQIGIGIAIDDFGTGYSSLSYLKRFPIRTLKIDRSFIRDLPDDPSDAQLVETIMLMAHNLGIDVVAEGVESEAQLEWLRRYRCEQIQGYVYSGPLPVDDFLAFVDAGPVPGTGEETGRM